MRRLQFAVLLFTVAVLRAAPAPDPLLNKPAPSFARSGLDNRPVDLAALRGHVVLLNFWATWCAGCVIEMPRFVAWQSTYAADGLAIVGVSMDDDEAPVRSFVQKREVNYPIIMGDEKLGLRYGGVLGLPVTYLIDRQGIVRARFEGDKQLDAMEATPSQAPRRPLKELTC